MLEIIYFSKTGNVKRFIEKTMLTATEGNENLIMQSKFVLVMYNTGLGEYEPKIEQFLNLNSNYSNCIGICSSGNKNWGNQYQNGAIELARKYNVPLLQKFELAGSTDDVEKFIKLIKELNEQQRIHKV